MQAIAINNNDLDRRNAERILTKLLTPGARRVVTDVYADGCYLVLLFDAPAHLFVVELIERRIDMSVYYGGDSKVEIDRVLKKATTSAAAAKREDTIRSVAASILGR